MDQSIKAGVLGFILAIIINLLSPVYLDLIPSFIAAVLLIYIFRLGTLKDGLVAALMTYIFNDGVLGTAVLATLYLGNEPYPSINVDIWILLSPVVEAVSAVISGYVGVWLVQKSRPIREELPPAPPSQLPPV